MNDDVMEIFNKAVDDFVETFKEGAKRFNEAFKLCIAKETGEEKQPQRKESNLDNTIKELNRCITSLKQNQICSDDLIGMMSDAVTLLEETKPRLLERREIYSYGKSMWLDVKDNISDYALFKYGEYGEEALTFMYRNGIARVVNRHDFMKTWRVWSEKPTNEQIKKTPWDGGDYHEWMAYL